MPCKNAEVFLEDCISSIIAQTYLNWELVIVDYHSTDNSKKIIERFVKKDQRIKLFDNTEKGIIPALNLAFSKSKGAFISRMDADDVMPKDKFKSLKRLLGSQKKTVATSKVRYFSNEQVSHGYLNYQNWLNMMNESCDFEKNIYRECVVASPNWLVHRTCFEEDIKLDQLEYPEDYDMTLKWYGLGYQFITSPEMTQQWREHPDRTTRNSERYKQTSFFKLKLKHFVHYELDQKEEVQLIGAGTKGKLTASILTNLKRNYEWYDFNQTRLENNQLKDVKNIRPIRKTLMTNWPYDEKLREGISKFLKDKGFVFGENTWIL